MITLETVKSEFQKLIHLTDTNIIDVVLGCVIANQIEGDPISLYIVGPPSTAKTEILRGLQGYKRTYHLSKITPTTLFSGYIHRAKKGQNYPQSLSEKSLVIRLSKEGKNIVVIKDFTTILTMRHENRSEIISQIREVADGYYTSVYGSGEQIQWQGKIAFIAGVTPAIDEYHGVNQILGERFLCYRCKNEDQIEISNKVIDTSPHIMSIRESIKEVVRQFLLRLEPNSKILPFGHGILEKLIHLAVFVAEIRTAVIRDKQRQVITPPMTEGAGRITRQLLYIAFGIAIVREIGYIDAETYTLVKKIARDTVNQWRLEIIKHVYSNPGISAQELCSSISLSLTGVKSYLQDMELIGILRWEEGEHNRKKWYITDKFKKIIDTSEVMVYDYIW